MSKNDFMGNSQLCSNIQWKNTKAEVHLGFIYLLILSKFSSMTVRKRYFHKLFRPLVLTYVRIFRVI